MTTFCDCTSILSLLNCTRVHSTWVCVVKLPIRLALRPARSRRGSRTHERIIFAEGTGRRVILIPDKGVHLNERKG